MIDALCAHGNIVIPALLGAITLMSAISLYWIKKYIEDRDRKDEAINAKLDKALQLHDDCQKNLPEKFVMKADFMQFLSMRSAEHALINSRLMALENQQAKLLAKMDVFLDDTTSKIKRLSETFVSREGVISERIDRLAENYTKGNQQ